MKGYRNRFRSVPAMLMCVVFLMTGGSIPALAEKQAATPTDLIGTEEPAAEESQEEVLPESQPAETEQEVTLSGQSEAEDILVRMSPENAKDKVTAFVTRCYWLILGREPDPNGLGYWTDKLKSRKATAAAVIAGFLVSNEFKAKHVSAEALVEILYRTMLNRASDDSGRRYWLKNISDGFSMNELVNGFCTSNEFKALCAEYGIESGKLESGSKTKPAAYSESQIAFVTRCYREALGRNPDESGMYYWCNKLAMKKITYAQVASGFVFSNEMKNKHLNNVEFIRMLYRLYLGRDAEESGLNYWKQKMAGGMTREQVNEGFAKSREFATIAAAYDTESGTQTEYSYIIVPGDNKMTISNGTKVKAQLSPQMGAAGMKLKWSSSDPKIFTVSQDGTMFGVYPGRAVLKVASSDGKTIAEINVQVQANYRAVLFSESTFAGGVIRRNRGDVRLMKNMLSSVTGPDGEKYRIYTYDDLAADQVKQKITDLLITPSRDGDVSIFFFASHGDYRSTSRQYAGRLFCRYKKTWIELPDLASRLSRVKGKVIVLLETCGPGAALREFDSNDRAAANDGNGEAEETENAEDYMSVISAFTAADPGLTVYQTDDTFYSMKAALESGKDYTLNGSSGGNLFLTEKFIVMVASAYLQASYSIGTDTYNLFPYWLVKGVGTSGAMPADKECGNGDGLLTVNELFQYVYKYTKYKQTPQVYPEKCNYVLFKR